MAVINTNITSMIGQNNLNKSQNDLSTAMERLSSGLRINSAKDDAAGQAIANRMTSQVTGLTQASRNANDGISLAQTTEGALDQINDNLQRVRELTVQATNGTNSDSDLSSIQDEIDARLNEIDRVSAQTDFNGTKVLDGSKTNISIQVGADDNQTISISLQKMDSGSLGLDSFDVSKLAKSVSAGGFDDTTNTAAADATFSFTDGTNAVDSEGLTVLKGSDDAYYVQDADGKTYATTATTVADGDGVAADGTGTDVSITFDPADALTAEEASAVGVSPLADLDSALSKVDGMRSDLGAVQNRFESAIDNLSTTTTNLSAAKSRIEDADYAVEVSNMTRAQILQQAGTSVLAQANQVPQGVLSLLQ
ncbi:FliC/FljB family flagellin [Salinicola halophyticus]|uniref:FliC/FljB family flagellin n=1 Tax=Salinicola halophyticus TaxID=1808881 RepID=UPI000DA23B60|nr:FliC/FljB family flagellin [Salinicola halophyticus]